MTLRERLAAQGKIAHGPMYEHKTPDRVSTPDALQAVQLKAGEVDWHERRARAWLDVSREELRAAIREAHQAGHSYRAIAEAAGISHQRVAQLLQKEEK